jgi:hypothetical protein
LRDNRAQPVRPCRGEPESRSSFSGSKLSAWSHLNTDEYGSQQQIAVFLQIPLGYHLGVSKNTTTPVRLTPEQDAILKAVAAACGVKEADVARWAVEALGDYWNHHGKRLLLPLRFTETFRVTTIQPDRLVLTEPPLRAESKQAQPGGRHKMNKPRRTPTVPAQSRSTHGTIS